jgi:hypothetical protein
VVGAVSFVRLKGTKMIEGDKGQLSALRLSCMSSTTGGKRTVGGMVALL